MHGHIYAPLGLLCRASEFFFPCRSYLFTLQTLVQMMIEVRRGDPLVRVPKLDPRTQIVQSSFISEAQTY